MKKYDVAVIGAGAAGLVCAGFLGKQGKTVALIDKNEKPGRKLMITGKGRCNITNLCDNQTLINSVTKNNKFMYSAFSNFNSYDTVDLIENLGVPTKVERGNRVFPVSDKACDVVDGLYSLCHKNNVEYICDVVEDLEIVDGKITSIVCEKDKIFADNFVLATGGKSYPRTGSTGDGYILAKKCGHTIISPLPSLVPLNVCEGAASKMQGLSLKNIEINVEDTLSGKEVFRDFGEMLFTHFGLSGPVILSASAHMRNMSPERYKIHIDLKPALDFEKLNNRVLRDFSENSNKDFANCLSKLLPAKMIPVIIKISGISEHEKVNQITKEQREKLCSIIKDFCFTVSSFRPIEEAIVTSGGVDCKEINPKTCKSKLIENLYFAGEIIDVDAYTGGFNLQIAFSTASAVANNIN